MVSDAVDKGVHSATSQYGEHPAHPAAKPMGGRVVPGLLCNEGVTRSLDGRVVAVSRRCVGPVDVEQVSPDSDPLRPAVSVYSSDESTGDTDDDETDADSEEGELDAKPGDAERDEEDEEDEMTTAEAGAGEGRPVAAPAMGSSYTPATEESPLEDEGEPAESTPGDAAADTKFEGSGEGTATFEDGGSDASLGVEALEGTPGTPATSEVGDDHSADGAEEEDSPPPYGVDMTEGTPRWTPTRTPTPDDYAGVQVAFPNFYSTGGRRRAVDGHLVYNPDTGVWSMAPGADSEPAPAPAPAATGGRARRILRPVHALEHPLV